MIGPGMSRSGLHCKDCDYSTWILANLKAHVFRIHMKSKFECTCCELSFNSRKITTNHLKEAHNSTDESQILSHCKVCSFSTDDFKSFEEHCETIHFPPGTRRKRGRKKKLQLNGNDEVKRVKKEPSQLRKKLLPIYEKNPNRKNDGPTNIRCNICSSDARDGRDLIVHKLTTHGLCKYACSKCDYKTRHCNAMSAHGYKEHQQSIRLKLACGFCPAYEKVYAMQEHMFNAHPEEFKKKSLAKLYHCKYCDYQNISQRKFMRHTASVHPGESIEKFQSDNEEITTITIDEVIAPNVNNSGKLVTASEINSEVDKLLGRQGIKGVGRHYVCKACGKTSEHIQNLRTHIEIHINNIEVSCPKCWKKFTTRSSLRAHAKKEHDTSLNISRT